MEFIKIKYTALAAAMLGLTATAHAVDPASAPIEFDPDGKGGQNSPRLIQTLDWAVNSQLNTSALADQDNPAKNIIPWDDATSKLVQVYFHSALQGYQDPGGDPGGIIGLNGAFEITVVGGVGLEGERSGDGLTFDILAADDNANPDPADAFEYHFRMYYDDLTDASGVKSDAISGAGFADGDVILEGRIIRADGTFNTTGTSELLDDFGDDDWNGTSSITGTGGEQAWGLVVDADPDFFTDGQIGNGSLLHFTSQTVLSFLQGNPSMNLDTDTGTIPSEVGGTNGQSGPDLLEQIDPNTTFTPVPEKFACRVTGGGNDTSGIPVDESAGWDESMAQTIGRTTGNKKRYTWWWTMGGQAGANTAQQPQPKGEWEHQNRGEFGDWGFHAGTASGIRGTEVDLIVCSDSGWCKQARPAPTKQIDFEGAGNFNNMPGTDKTNPNGKDVGKPSEDPFANFPFFEVSARETLHWYDVHIEDLGEPGNIAQAANIGTPSCPAPDLSDPANVIGGGSGTDAFAEPPVFNLANCECPDYYRIRIYAGLTPQEIADALAVGVEDIYNGKVLTDAARDVLKAHGKSQASHYTAEGYLDGGNFQIHPVTGFDLHQR